MLLRYNFRIYPTRDQREALARAFGCARVVYNDGLRLRQQAWENGRVQIRDAALQRLVITEAKRTPERAWLADVSYDMLVQSLNDLHRAYRNYTRSLTGKHKRNHFGPPKFKSKKDRRASVRFSRNSFVLRSSGHLYLAKIGDVRVEWSRGLPSLPSSATVSLDPAGRYHVSFVVNVPQEPLPARTADVGVDLGLTHFAVLSTGEKVDNPRWHRAAEKRIARLHRALWRRQVGSRNREKARRRLARAHAKVADKRRDQLHKLSTRLIRENQAVYVEDLCVGALRRTRMAKSVHDAGWTIFTRMLAYKADLYGRVFVKVNRFLPSTRVCSECGRLGDKLSLSVRSWTCPCGAAHDRDINAAKNILAAGRAESLNACGGGVRPGLALATASEAGTPS